MRDEHVAVARSPWAWVPTLYFAEGIPYIVVMTVSVIMYKKLGISNAEIALYTSWLYLPWVIKPLWSPVVDLLRTKRFWIVTMQLLIGAGLGGVALTIPVPEFFQYTLLFFWLLAFSSATHDIAADGFYMLGLTENEQAFFVGIRSTFYRFAMITGSGLLIMLAGYVESTTGLEAVDVAVDVRPAGTPVPPPPSAESSALEGRLRLIPARSALSLEAVPLSSRETDSVIAAVRASNVENGFIEREEGAPDLQGEFAPSSASAEESWLARTVVLPIENFLRENFAPGQTAAQPTDLAGNLAVLEFRLSGPPAEGEQIVVNFGWESGDKSIGLVEGNRFVFTHNNWSAPARAAIQLDPKLRTASSAVFTARAGNIPLSWIITFSVLAVLFGVFFVYHRFILPHPPADGPARDANLKNPFREFLMTFVLFLFHRSEGGYRLRRGILAMVGFLLLFRFAEAQLVKLAAPFLLDAQEAGGLALTTGQVGFVYGTVGLVALTLGGLLGGFLAARHGLKSWLWWMVLAINIPDLVYVYMSQTTPTDMLIINICVAIEQFGYGFGFTAYMLYMIYISQGQHKTAHYAICTAFMALGMMIPGMFSGWVQEIIGYQNFFIWILFATVPAFLVTALIPLEPNFGKKGLTG